MVGHVDSTQVSQGKQPHPRVWATSSHRRISSPIRDSRLGRTVFPVHPCPGKVCCRHRRNHPVSGFCRGRDLGLSRRVAPPNGEKSQKSGGTRVRHGTVPRRASSDHRCGRGSGGTNGPSLPSFSGAKHRNRFVVIRPGFRRAARTSHVMRYPTSETPPLLLRIRR